MDDVASGATALLLSTPAVVAAVGQFPVGHPFVGEPYIFQRKLYTRVEGTSSQAVVLSYAGGWSPPVDGSQAVFSRLSVEIYVDPVRDGSGNITNPAETENRARSLYKVIDKPLNSLDSDIQVWGDLALNIAARLTEPLFYEVPDGDGLIRGQWFYGLEEIGNLVA